MIFKYTDATMRVVARTLENGNVESYSVDAFAFQAWLAQGNAPLPADPVVPQPAPLTIEHLAAALVAKGVMTQGDVVAAAAQAGVKAP